MVCGGLFSAAHTKSQWESGGGCDPVLGPATASSYSNSQRGSSCGTAAGAAGVSSHSLAVPTSGSHTCSMGMGEGFHTSLMTGSPQPASLLLAEHQRGRCAARLAEGQEEEEDGVEGQRHSDMPWPMSGRVPWPVSGHLPWSESATSAATAGSTDDAMFLEFRGRVGWVGGLGLSSEVGWGGQGVR